MSDVDSTAVEIGSELVPAHPAHQPPTTLFRTDDPVEVVEQATRVANALKSVIVSRGLAKNIQGRDHVLVEGWTTLGSMLGVVPVVEWSRPVTGSGRRFTRREKVDHEWKQMERNGCDWEARVTARTLDGRVIGAAEATCSREESAWSERDDYALRSMAQTRATSKALRGPLGFVVTLAGYAATPAEEMPADGGGGESGSSRSLGAPRPRTATEKQLNYVRSLLRKQKVTLGETRRMLQTAGLKLAEGDDTHAGVARLTAEQASSVIEFLKSGHMPTGESDIPADADDFTHPPAPPQDIIEPAQEALS